MLRVFLPLLCLLAFAKPAFSLNSLEQCAKLAQETARRGAQLTSPIPNSWSSAAFSDPRRHDARHFVYIVHGVGSSLYDLQDLDYGLHAEHIWASIISNDARFTYMQESGLILSIEPDNIVSNSCYDTVSRIKDQSDYAGYIAQHSQATPRQMLEGSLWPYWMREEDARAIVPSLVGGNYKNNELLLMGQGKAGSVVRTVGVFINKLDDYQPTITALKEFAARYSLPIIEINPEN